MRDPLVVCCENRRKSEPYTEALLMMGVDPERLYLVTPEEPQAELTELGAQAAGIVLCGGPDLGPEWYGEQPRDDAQLSILPELDRMDWQLLEGAETGRRPVWAICRGMQTFNVFQGGTLWQDLPTPLPHGIEHRPPGPDDALAHEIRVTDPDDTFAELLADEPVEVNSRHHQAIRELGRQVRPLAESADGVIEVMALDRQDWWVKGVQWHPENLMHLSLQRRLWHEFLTTVDRTATTHGAAPVVR